MIDVGLKKGYTIIYCFIACGYARHIFNVAVRGKAISEFRSPNALPRAPTPLGTELVLHLRCVTLLTLACILRYSECNSLPIWLSVFYGIENDSFWRSHEPPVQLVV